MHCKGNDMQGDQVDLILQLLIAAVGPMGLYGWWADLLEKYYKYIGTWTIVCVFEYDL